MKKIVYIFVIMLLGVQALNAQIADDRVKISDFRVVGKQSTVKISFTAKISPKAAKAGHTFIFAPVISDDDFQVSFPAVIVEGRRMKVLRERYGWAAGEEIDYQDAVKASNGDRVSYSASVQAQEWMTGADVRIESFEGGCCSYDYLPHAVVAENILAPQKPIGETLPPVVEVLAPLPVQEYVKSTIGDKLSERYSFIVPVSSYDPSMPFKIDEIQRESAPIVYYRVGKSDIDLSYMDNARTLRQLISAISSIIYSPESDVKRIVVAGFASPEGSYRLNQKLAYSRALSVKDQIVWQTGIKVDDVAIYNGGIDWDGLRFLVERSDMWERYDVLNIIDSKYSSNYQEEDDRLIRLKRLNNGITYQYLYRELFPKLRTGSYVKVYYENKR